MFSLRSLWNSSKLNFIKLFKYYVISTQELFYYRENNILTTFGQFSIAHDWTNGIRFLVAAFLQSFLIQMSFINLNKSNTHSQWMNLSNTFSCCICILPAHLYCSSIHRSNQYNWPFRLMHFKSEKEKNKSKEYPSNRM